MAKLTRSRLAKHPISTSLARLLAAFFVLALPFLGPVGVADAASGSIWSIVKSPNGSTTSVSNNILSGVSAISDSDVWAVGYFNSTNNNVINETLAEHWNGAAWSVVATPNVGTMGSQFQGVSAF